MARKIVDIVPCDMVREWSGDRAAVRAAAAAERRFGLRKLVQRALVLGRLGLVLLRSAGPRSPSSPSSLKGSRMFVQDGAVALSRERTPEGFLQVRARIGRAGIHDYKAGEIGGPEGAPPERIVRVLRPPEDVFDPQSLDSFAAKPVTLDHPPRMVDSGNWKAFAVGHSAQRVTREGDHVAADLIITDAAAVARAEAGAELSNGYWADFVFEPGQTPDGEVYDALQRNIRGNHIALVDAGRCGPTCRVDPAVEGPATGDAAPTCGCAFGDGSSAAERRRATIDGVVVETDAAGVSALAELQARLDDARAEQRRALELRDGELAALRAVSLDAARLDALVLERVGVIDAARQVLGTGFEGRTLATAAIRRAAVEKLLGPEMTRDRSDDYIAAAFDALVAARASSNPLAAHVAAGLEGRAVSREAAMAARNRYLTDAWKGDIQTGAA